MLIKYLIPLLTLTSFSSWATVDMKNANFTDEWVDLKMPATGFDLKVERTYNSRSLHNGMFGFGWCTDLETKLEQQDSGAIHITSCGPYAATVFYPESANAKELQAYVTKLAQAHVKAGNSMSQKAFHKLVDNLTQSRVERENFAKKYRISLPITESTKFVNLAAKSDEIVKRGGQWIRSFGSGQRDIFDSKGNLVEKRDTNGNFLKYTYRANELQQVQNQAGQRLSFFYTPNAKVAKISGPNDLLVEYKYRKSDMIYVKNAWKNEYSYEVDNLHNITKISYPDKTTREIQYDTKKDWVIGFKDREGCTESYDFDVENNQRYSTSLVKKCKGKVVNQSKFDFWYETSPTRGSYLAKVRTSINGKVKETQYHPEFGRPVVEIENGRKQSFSYYPDGTVKTKTENGTTSKFTYDKDSGKVSSVVVGNLKSSFRYDKRGNLIYASNSKGQKVKLEYDKSGRIVGLMDHAKRIVRIQYNEKIGKPSRIERPGLGDIVVRYDRNGEITKVDSQAGPSVAVQVASTFNNLLEIVKPAGVELGI